MPEIILKTYIKQSPEICFDLSRSIELHSISVGNTKERAVEGVCHGLIELGETVTWEAVHFGIRQRLTSKISKMERPLHFRDEQVKGVFKSFYHDHFFEQTDDGTLMTDRFVFESPLGWLGKLFNHLVLTNYMKKFLEIRNSCIKTYAESERWKEILNNN